MKGIVYYIDRIEQLKTQQHLILGTPSPVAPPPQKIHQDLSAIAISLAATHSFDDGEGEVASKHPVKVKVKRGRTAMGLDHRDVIADVKPTTRKSDKRLKTTDVDMATVAVTAREASRLQPRRSTSAASRKNK